MVQLCEAFASGPRSMIDAPPNRLLVVSPAKTRETAFDLGLVIEEVWRDAGTKHRRPEHGIGARLRGSFLPIS